MYYLKIIELAKINIGNTFDLILIASKRARHIQNKIIIPLLDNDEYLKYKPTLIALKEISKGFINKDYLYVTHNVNTKDTHDK